MTRPIARGTGVPEVLLRLWCEADAFVRARLGVAVFLVAASAVLAALAPLALQQIIDGLSADEGARLPGKSLWLIAGYVLSQWFARAASELRGSLHGRAEQRLFRHLSHRLFAHVMALPLRFHLDRQTGAVSQTLANGLTGYRLLLHHLVYTALPVAAELLTMAVVLIQLGHSEFLGILAVATTAYALAFAIGVSRITEPGRAVSAAQVHANAVLTDSVLNYETVKYFDAEAQVQARFDAALRDAEYHWGDFYGRNTVNGIGVATIFALSLAVSIGVAAHAVARGTMSVGEFVLVNTYLLQVVRPLEMLGFALRDVAQGLAFIEKSVDLYREKPEPQNASGRTLSTGQGSLVVERVTFAYRPGRPVLREVSFALGAGQTVAIVGPSGSGKSSLVRLLVRLYEPDSGRMLLDGIDTSEMSVSELRRAIAVVPQDTVLFNDTIAYNIGFGKPGSIHAEIEAAARAAHLHDFIVSLPEGYETRVGERGLKLSGGEKQRVSIARAALKQPRVFVFDEATSSLDTRTEREIARNLTELSRGTTTLVIAHRLSTIIHADEIVVLNQGQVAERGTHEVLLRADRLYATLWRAQQHGAPKAQGDASVSAA